MKLKKGDLTGMHSLISRAAFNFRTCSSRHVEAILRPALLLQHWFDRLHHIHCRSMHVGL